MNLTKLTYTIPILLIATNFAQAQTCTPAPSCAELGFTKTAANCSGKSMMKCPFDQSKVFCEDGASCASLGFTDTISECPGDYVICPNDSSKGKCHFEARAGDLKYSLRTSDHNGWLLCNGRLYSRSQYPDLYPAISSSFGDYLPNYSGYFLKAAATTNGSNLKTAEQAGLPNLSGYVGGILANTRGGINNSKTGVFSGTPWFPITKNAIGNDTNGWWNDSAGIDFNASRSSSIYGRSSTVTPQNYSANVFIYTGRKK